MLIKTSQEVDPGKMYESFQSNNHLEVIERYIINTQIFAKRFREVAGRSLIIPKRIGAEEVSPQQFQQKADALLQRHRSIEDSLLIKEAKAEIMFGDIDIKSLTDFLEASKESEARIVHTKVPVPSRLGMSLYMSTFEDLLSMKTRAFLVKDIDPEILRRLLGNRSLATELTDEQLKDYYDGKVPNPQNEKDEDRKNSLERSLNYMGLKPNMAAKDIKIDKVFIGSCTNGRIEDLREAAKILKDKKIASHVHAMVVPGSGLVKEQAEQEGLDKIFVSSGFEWREPGCSMCLAMNADKLKPQERCASTSNRNFEGRQGRGGRTHLVSPGMAAAAAISGNLDDVRKYQS